MKSHYVAEQIAKLQGCYVLDSTVSEDQIGFSWSAIIEKDGNQLRVEKKATSQGLLMSPVKGQVLPLLEALCATAGKSPSSETFESVVTGIVDAWDLLSQLESKCEARTVMLTAMCQPGEVEVLNAPFSEESRLTVQNGVGSELMSILNEEILLFKQYKALKEVVY